MSVLNDKQKQILERIAEGSTHIAAWQSQYPTAKYGSAGAACSKLLGRPEAQEYLNEAKARVAALVQEAFIIGCKSAKNILNNPTAYRTQFGPTFKIIKELAAGPQKVELSGPDGAPIKLESLPNDQLKDLTSKLDELKDKLDGESGS